MRRLLLAVVVLLALGAGAAGIVAAPGGAADRDGHVDRQADRPSGR